jgi:hypothetical protein
MSESYNLVTKNHPPTIVATAPKTRKRPWIAPIYLDPYRSASYAGNTGFKNKVNSVSPLH